MEEGAGLGGGVRVGGGGAFGETVAVVEDELVIEESERLEGGGGEAADGGGETEFGEVEDIHEGIGDAAPDDPVDAAAACAWGVPVEVEVIEFGGGLRAGAFGEEFDAWAADGGVEPVGDGEDGVAERIGVETGAVHAPEETVIGVEGGGVFV